MEALKIKPWRVLTEIEGNGGIEGKGVTSGREVFALDALDALDVYGPPLPLSRPVPEEDLLGPAPAVSRRGLGGLQRERVVRVKREG